MERRDVWIHAVDNEISTSHSVFDLIDKADNVTRHLMKHNA